MDIDTLWARYKDAANMLTRNDSSISLATRRNAEQRYALAYRALVMAGAMPKLKKKYTGGI